MARQSEDALSRARRINELLSKWRSAMAGARAALQAIELLGANPFITVRNLQRDLKTSYNTASRAVAALEKADIVRNVSETKRDRVYCGKAILDILEEPARLMPEPKHE